MKADLTPALDSREFVLHQLNSALELVADACSEGIAAGCLRDEDVLDVAIANEQSAELAFERLRSVYLVLAGEEWQRR